MQAFRYCWGLSKTVRCNFQWDIINKDSFVVVTASEGSEFIEGGSIIMSTASPKRFVGSARFTVDNIAPHEGGVTFRVTIDWPRPLMLWTDIIVLDGIPFGMDAQHRG